MLSFLDARHCQITDEAPHVCTVCVRQFDHPRIVVHCRKGTAPPQAARAYNAQPETLESRRAACAVCDLFQRDRGTLEPICILIPCCGGRKATEKGNPLHSLAAAALVNRFNRFLANARSECPLKKWKREEFAA